MLQHLTESGLRRGVHRRNAWTTRCHMTASSREVSRMLPEGRILGKRPSPSDGSTKLVTKMTRLYTIGMPCYTLYCKGPTATSRHTGCPQLSPSLELPHRQHLCQPKGTYVASGQGLLRPRYGKEHDKDSGETPSQPPEPEPPRKTGRTCTLILANARNQRRNAIFSQRPSTQQAYQSYSLYQGSAHLVRPN